MTAFGGGFLAVRALQGRVHCGLQRGDFRGVVTRDATAHPVCLDDRDAENVPARRHRHVGRERQAVAARLADRLFAGQQLGALEQVDILAR